VGLIIIQTFLLTILLVFSAFPWGAVGHETVAYIAEQNLCPTVREKIKPLLARESLEEISIWADTYKRNHRNTGPWHYIDLPVRQNIRSKDIPRYYLLYGRHPTNNIISQINEEILVLKNSQTSFKEKQLALKYLVHFIGDVHMPFHTADDNDKGGNGKKVRFFAPTSRSNRGHVTNLHSLWDNLVEIKAAEDPVQLGDELNKKISSAEKEKWSAGSVEDWAIESHDAANKIFEGLPPGSSENVTILARNYYFKMRPIVDEQLEKAGVRLAKVLEDIF
jgi:hypothetical protein